MSATTASELGLTPKLRRIASSVAGVDPSIMGTGPVPAAEKAPTNAGLTMEGMAVVELNEAFAAQCLHCLDRLGLERNDPRVNQWGGAIGCGRPLAASGPRLVAFLPGPFREQPDARYMLKTMCMGRGQGHSIIWENMQPLSRP